jgi:Lrp/AsnC family transcriptional regulator for asnA, asnC and gidA
MLSYSKSRGVLRNMIDDLDREILNLLQENSRTSSRELARTLKEQKNIDVSFSTVSRRIKELEDKGVIRRYTTIIDPNAFGLNYPICFFIETDPKVDVEEVAQRLVEIPDLLYVHQVAGDFQIASMARCRSAEEAAELSKQIAKIKGVQKLVSHSVLCTFKEDIRLKLDE